LAFISAIDYLKNGSRVLLYLAVAVLVLGCGALVAGLLRRLPSGGNANVTVFNTSVLASAVLHTFTPQSAA
jgi:uncharacterized membrane-anchored protein